jgi:hypothetical protein
MPISVTECGTEIPWCDTAPDLASFRQDAETPLHGGQHPSVQAAMEVADHPEQEVSRLIDAFQLPTCLAEDGFPSSFWYKHDMTPQSHFA